MEVCFNVWLANLLESPQTIGKRLYQWRLVLVKHIDICNHSLIILHVCIFEVRFCIQLLVYWDTVRVVCTWTTS